MTEQDTYEALCRSPIDQVDQAVLDTFFNPPYCAVQRDTYELSCLNEAEVIILLKVLKDHRWTLRAYLEKTVISFPDIR